MDDGENWAKGSGLASCALIASLLSLAWGWEEWRPMADMADRWDSYQMVNVRFEAVEAAGTKYPKWKGRGWVDGKLIEFTKDELHLALGPADAVWVAWEDRVRVAKEYKGREMRVKWNADAITRVAPAAASLEWARDQGRQAAALSLLSGGFAIASFAWLFRRRWRK